MSNYSVYSIPVYYVLSILPHSYAISLITAANNGKWDNSSPRSSSYASTIQKSVPAACFAKYERAESAHKNGMENLAVFATAVVLGNLAKLPSEKLNAVTGLFLALRVAYTVAYVQISDHKKSFVRTGLWASGVACCMYLIVSAGNVLRGGWP